MPLSVAGAAHVYVVERQLVPDSVYVVLEVEVNVSAGHEYTLHVVPELGTKQPASPRRNQT